MVKLERVDGPYRLPRTTLAGPGGWPVSMAAHKFGLGNMLDSNAPPPTHNFITTPLIVN